jgi:crossover junction endodeoxyribonuclease RuvC
MVQKGLVQIRSQQHARPDCFGHNFTHRGHAKATFRSSNGSINHRNLVYDGEFSAKEIYMRILGIDPGTGILGFGVIQVDKGEARLVDAGVIRTPVKEDDAVRLQTIFDELTDIIVETKPDEMAVEKLFFARNVTTAMTVAQARGVVLLCGKQAGLEIYEYTPMQIKQALTGYGKAEKKQIQEMVKIILQLREIPRPDDAADALATAITHSMTMR